MKILHFQSWQLKNIIKELPKVKEQGFDTIQISPVQPYKIEKRNVNGKIENRFFWWSVYQPLGFRIGNSLGTEDDLKRLCEAAHELGLKVCVDVVANHTANKGGSEEEKLIPHEDVDPVLRDNPNFWKHPNGKTKDGKPAKCVENGEDREDAVKNAIGLPSLDCNNPDLQKIIGNFIIELHECGVDGIRWDAAKHIGTPRDGVSFFPNMSKLLQKLNMFSYAEVLSNNPKNTSWVKEFIDPNLCGLDFVLTGKEIELDQKKQILYPETHDSLYHEEGEFGFKGSTKHKKQSIIDLQYLKTMLQKPQANFLYTIRPNPIAIENFSKSGSDLPNDNDFTNAWKSKFIYFINHYFGVNEFTIAASKIKARVMRKWFND